MAGRDRRLKDWDHLFSARAAISIKSMEILESSVFAPQTVEFGRANLIVGPHGSGKSLLLRILQHCLLTPSYDTGPPFVDREFFPRQKANSLTGRVRLTVNVRDKMLEHEIDLADSFESRLERWQFDELSWEPPVVSSPTAPISELSLYFQEYPYAATDVEVLRQSNRQDLDGIRSILGRRYDSLSICQVCVDHGGSGVDPRYEAHFSAVLNGRPFDATAMSMGELSVNYVLGWTIDATSNGAPVLVDEPEAFISTRGHWPFIDEIARRIRRAGSQLLVASHSPRMFSRFPLESTLLCVPSPLGIRVVRPESEGQLLDATGVEIPLLGLVLVEDHTAQRVLEELCREYDPYLLREIEIVAAGGVSEIKAGLRVVSQSRHVRFAAVLDGDARDSSDAIADALFLPGDREPEAELVESLSRSSRRAASFLRRAESELLTALDAAAQSDHQYWIRSMARLLAIDESQLVSAAVRLWLESGPAGDPHGLVVDLRRRFTN